VVRIINFKPLITLAIAVGANARFLAVGASPPVEQVLEQSQPLGTQMVSPGWERSRTGKGHGDTSHGNVGNLWLGREGRSRGDGCCPGMPWVIDPYVDHTLQLEVSIGGRLEFLYLLSQIHKIPQKIHLELNQNRVLKKLFRVSLGVCLTFNH
jgi:hypothetical protein